MASLGFCILLLAVDFAVIRARILFEQAASVGWVLALFLLPMIDILLVSLYRMRRPERRTAGAIGFLGAGFEATAAIFAFGAIAPHTLSTILETILEPAFDACVPALSWLLGNAWRQELILEVLDSALIVVFPMTLLSLSCLVVALAGRGIARRMGPWNHPSASLIGPA
jgi:hypothetical protein